MIEIRKILRGLLAQFAIAKGMPDHAAMITRLAPTATSKHIKRRRGSIGDISTRVFGLQQKINAGIVEKEQETELGMLISCAIFSRNKDHATKLVIMTQEAALSARNIADRAPFAEMAELLHERAIAAEKEWLSSELQKGLKVLDLQSASTDLSWVSKLRFD